MARPTALLLSLALLILTLTTLVHSKSNSATTETIEEQPIELDSSPLIDSSLLAPQKPHSYAALPKNIPQYFSSKDTCLNQTNACSGHGTCIKAHNQYKCACTPTKVREDKTVRWGGNACQKKDVSVEFALFGGFGVVFVGLVAGVVGLLYSMGAEGLPSVIGAGVVGGTARHQ